MMPAASRFLAVRMQPYDVGLDAVRVLRVELRADWAGPVPPDLEHLLFGTGPTDAVRRVLVIDTGQEHCVLGTSRDLTLREFPDSGICDLPNLLWAAQTRPLLSGIAAPDEGAHPLLVLDLEALRARLVALLPKGETP